MSRSRCILFSLMLALGACHQSSPGLSIDLSGLHSHAAQREVSIDRLELRVSGRDIDERIVVGLDVDTPVFDISVPAGQNRRVEVEAFTNDGEGGEVPVYWGLLITDIPADGAIDVTIPVFAAGRVSGTVRRVDDIPLPQGLVITMAAVAPRSDLLQVRSVPVANGGFELTLPTGAHRVSVNQTSEGLVLPKRMEVAIVQGATERIELVLVPSDYCGSGASGAPDSDGDQIPDLCDVCPADNPNDTDFDGVCDSDDPCRLDNPDDANGDGVCDSEEAPGVFVSVAGASTEESALTLTFTVSLSEAAAETIMVSYETVDTTASSVADGSGEVDYVAASGTLTFFAGETEKLVEVTLVDDPIDEDDETFLLQLFSPVEALLGESVATGTILDDDDPPTLTVGDATADESAGSLVFVVQASEISSRTITVDYATAAQTALAPGDFTAAAGALVIEAGSESGSIAVPLADDLLDEEDETFTITLENPNHASLGDGVALGTILDDDLPPTITFTAASSEVNEGATALLGVSLSGPSGKLISVPYSVNDQLSDAEPGLDFVPPSLLVTLPPEQVVAVADVQILDNQIVGPDRILVIDLGDPDHAQLGAITQHVVTIINDDFLPPVLNSARTLDADLDGRIDHYRLELNEDILDDTFPGFVADGLGEAQAEWLVEGHGHVVLAHGASAPEDDNPNDSVLYLRFAEGITPDTGSRPELTTTESPGLLNTHALELVPVGPGTAGETDGAVPILLRATAEIESDDLFIFFSEPVTDAGLCPTGGLAPSSLTYNDLSGDGMAGIAEGSDTDPCDDNRIVTGHPTDLFDPDDLYVDTIQATPAVVDMAGNPASETPVPISNVTYPYVVRATSIGDTDSWRLELSEPVDTGDLALQANYDIWDPGTSGPSCGMGPAMDNVAVISDTVVELAATDLVPGCLSIAAITGLIRDLDEGKAVNGLATAAFIVDEPFQLVHARSAGEDGVELTFSRDVLATGVGGADDLSLYVLAPELGAVTSAEVIAGNRVLLHHTNLQTGRLYTVGVSTTLEDSTGADLASRPYDRALFMGAGPAVDSLTAGPFAENVFMDGGWRNLTFAYRDRLYIGPHFNNDALYRFEPDGDHPVRVTFEIANESPDAASSFGAHLTVPVRDVFGATGTETLYQLPVGSDLALFGSYDTVVVTGCTDQDNDTTNWPALFVDDANDTILIDDTVAPVDSSIETCLLTIFRDDGPAGFDGVDSFNPVPIVTPDDLAFGAHNRGGGGYPLFHRSTSGEAILQVGACSLDSPLPNEIHSLQTIFAAASDLFFGFLSDDAERPLLGYIQTGPSGPSGGSGPMMDVRGSSGPSGPLGPCQEVMYGTSGYDETIASVAYIGAYGMPENPAPIIGIDSMALFDDSTGWKLFIANNGGVAATEDVSLTGDTIWLDMRHDVVDGDDELTRWHDTTHTRTAPSLGPLRPGERGIPFMVEWGGYLFVARNRDDNSAELWRYVFDAGPKWRRVLDTETWAADNTAVSLLLVAGGRLYVGFDNGTAGAELWRSNASITTPADLLDTTGIEQVGLSGFGPAGGASLAANAQIFSAAVIAAENGDDLIFITVGCELDREDGGPCDRNSATGQTDFGTRLFRQVAAP